MGTGRQEQPTVVHEQPQPVHGHAQAVHDQPQAFHDHAQAVHDPPPPYDASTAWPAAAHGPFPFPPPGATTVIQHRLAFAGPPPVGPQPTYLACPYCHAAVVTRVEVKPNNNTHTTALILLILGGILCFWIPYVMDSCQSKRHYCPSCGAYIGTYNN